jgi:hypothetical protein
MHGQQNIKYVKCCVQNFKACLLCLFVTDFPQFKGTFSGPIVAVIAEVRIPYFLTAS